MNNSCSSSVVRAFNWKPKDLGLLYQTWISISVTVTYLKKTFRDNWSISSSLVRSTPSTHVQTFYNIISDSLTISLPLRPTPFLLIEVTASCMVPLSDIRPLKTKIDKIICWISFTTWSFLPDENLFKIHWYISMPEWNDMTHKLCQMEQNFQFT